MKFDIDNGEKISNKYVYDKIPKITLRSHKRYSWPQITVVFNAELSKKINQMFGNQDVFVEIIKNIDDHNICAFILSKNNIDNNRWKLVYDGGGHSTSRAFGISHNSYPCEINTFPYTPDFEMQEESDRLIFFVDHSRALITDNKTDNSLSAVNVENSSIFLEIAKIKTVKITHSNEISTNSSGVYFLFCANELVYIGESKNFRRRLSAHTNKDYDRIEWLSCINKKIAVATENELLNLFKNQYKILPRYNKNSGIKINV